MGKEECTCGRSEKQNCKWTYLLDQSGKRQGYNLEHRYSHNYQATKNHYYLIQIGHMVAQIIEEWKKIWEGIQQSREQKHRRMLENFKMVDLKEYKEEIQEQCQIRFE